jgi:glutamate formiminotransferase
VKTATGDIWAAATQFKVKVGDKVVVPLSMPMQNFHSGTLNRTFPLIYFTSTIQKEGAAPAAPAKSKP